MTPAVPSENHIQPIYKINNLKNTAHFNTQSIKYTNKHITNY